MAKQPISIVRGTTFQLAVSLTDEDGNPYALQSGELLRYGLKKSPNDAQYLIVKDIDAGNVDSSGAYVFNFAVSDTANLPFGNYYYDVGLQSGNNYYNIIEASNFKIAFNVTEWEA